MALFSKWHSGCFFFFEGDDLSFKIHTNTYMGLLVRLYYDEY